jgi:hypothetical protein
MIKLEMVLQLDNENKVLCLITLVINKYRWTWILLNFVVQLMY